MSETENVVGRRIVIKSRVHKFVKRKREKEREGEKKRQKIRQSTDGDKSASF